MNCERCGEFVDFLYQDCLCEVCHVPETVSLEESFVVIESES
mgnify:CR=1 FL=1